MAKKRFDTQFTVLIRILVMLLFVFDNDGFGVSLIKVLIKYMLIEF